MIDYKVFTTDILVAGSGIAGLKAAINAKEKDNDVVVISKSEICASDFVLGFNAAVSQEDTRECFEEDTIKGGKFINNKDLVRTLAFNADSEVRSVENDGLEFDNDRGAYNLLKPLGCSHPRLVHIKNRTGKISLEKFKEIATEKGVRLFYGLMLCEIIVKNGKVVGAVALNKYENTAYIIFAKAVIITTGGIHIADGSTYSDCMTGDGYAIAYRAGARLTDMEFIQFEPVRCVYPKLLGISTTLLNKGGTITNKDGERFLLRNFASEGKASKDELARYIAIEILEGRGTEHGGVYLDLTSIPEDELKERHSLYYERFMNAGIDLTKQKVEVAPCAHSFMGGIVCDKKCRTDVDGLFVAGEAMGGLHGANRVGGNAGSEIFVFGTIAGKSALEYVKSKELDCDEDFASDTIKNYSINGNVGTTELENIKSNILKIMKKFMGPVREENGLVAAFTQLDGIDEKLKNLVPENFDALCVCEEVKNLLMVCRLSVGNAIKRKESRGVHYRLDYPKEDERYLKSFVCSMENGI